MMKLRGVIKGVGVAAVVAAAGCYKLPQAKPPTVENLQTPTRQLSTAEYPRFSDDMDLAGLELAISRQLTRFAQRDLSGTISFGEDIFPQRQLWDSLLKFQDIMRETKRCLADHPKSRDACWDELNQKVAENFNVYVPSLQPGDPRYGEEDPVLFTGYYTPHLWVSKERTSRFRHAIYNRPESEWHARLSRFQIDFQGALDSLGVDLFWSDSLFDLYLLHLEGGGRVSYIDDQGVVVSKYLSYNGANGQKWRFVVVNMISRNWISDPSLKAQREFVDSNPQLHPQIFSYCPSYVYFKVTDHPPEGSDSVPLTDNRSIATDRKLYPLKGALAFVQTQRPRSLKMGEMIPFSRFVLDQDTGGAIRGKGRVDFYFGEGEYAESAATTLRERGSLFYLVLKPGLSRSR